MHDCRVWCEVCGPKRSNPAHKQPVQRQRERTCSVLFCCGSCCRRQWRWWRALRMAASVCCGGCGRAASRLWRALLLRSPTDTMTLPRPCPDLGATNEPRVSSRNTAASEAPRPHRSCQPLVGAFRGLASSAASSSRLSSLLLDRKLPLMLLRPPCFMCGAPHVGEPTSLPLLLPACRGNSSKLLHESAQPTSCAVSTSKGFLMVARPGDCGMPWIAMATCLPCMPAV